MKIVRFLQIGALAAVITAVSAFAGNPSGTWTFEGETPKGRQIKSTLNLNLADGHLTGTIRNRAGTAPIENATFANDEIAFTVVREGRKGSVQVHYKGKLDGDVIRGTIQLEGPKKTMDLPWEATRVTGK